MSRDHKSFTTNNDTPIQSTGAKMATESTATTRPGLLYRVDLVADLARLTDTDRIGAVHRTSATLGQYIIQR